MQKNSEEIRKIINKKYSICKGFVRNRGKIHTKEGSAKRRKYENKGRKMK